MSTDLLLECQPVKPIWTKPSFFNFFFKRKKKRQPSFHYLLCMLIVLICSNKLTFFDSAVCVISTDNYRRKKNKFCFSGTSSSRHFPAKPETVPLVNPFHISTIYTWAEPNTISLLFNIKPKLCKFDNFELLFYFDGKLMTLMQHHTVSANWQ